MSQVIGFPGRSLDPPPAGTPPYASEWPSTSMVNWETGAGNARYWVLKMMIEELPTGAKRAPATASSDATLVHAQAFVTSANGDARKVLVVSKSAEPVSVSVAGAVGGRLAWVDGSTGDQFGCTEDAAKGTTCIGRVPKLASDTFTLGAFGTAIVVLP